VGGRAQVPWELEFVPFRGSDAVRRGIISRAMLRGSSWRRLLPDVYVHAEIYDPDDHRMWCRAAAITLPVGGAVDGYSAAFLWGLDLLPRDAPVSVTVPTGVRLSLHPRRLVRRASLAPEDITTLAGIPVTTPVRTAFDLGRQANRREAVIALDAMCHRHLVSIAEVGEYVTGVPGRRGVARLRERLDLIEPATESPMETHLRLTLIDDGAPPPRAQYEVRDSSGRLIARVDFAYPQWRIAIEYEGDHHRGRTQFRRDVTRLNALREAGWLVLRFTAHDLLQRPADIHRQVAKAIRERRQSAAFWGQTWEADGSVQTIRVARADGTVRFASGPSRDAIMAGTER
jgi:hypothetical protein